MRNLGTLWRHGTEDERRFVETVLLAYSGGGAVTKQDWREAERDWRNALRVQDAHGEVDPEYAAMNWLLALIFADKAMGLTP